jgi:hypothetical protein
MLTLRIEAMSRMATNATPVPRIAPHTDIKMLGQHLTDQARAAGPKRRLIATSFRRDAPFRAD